MKVTHFPGQQTPRCPLKPLPPPQPTTRLCSRSAKHYSESCNAITSILYTVCWKLSYSEGNREERGQPRSPGGGTTTCSSSTPLCPVDLRLLSEQMATGADPRGSDASFHRVTASTIVIDWIAGPYTSTILKANWRWHQVKTSVCDA